MMPQTADSKGASSSTIDSISQERGEKSPILTEISHNNTLDNDTVLELCSAAEQAVNFNADEYLQAFYSMPTNDTAMHTILFFLPGFPYWISENIRTLLDLGASPTVYVPITFRNHVKHIYGADYAENSCDMLKNWAENKSSFEWTEADVHAEPTIKCAHYKRLDNDDIPQQFHVVVSIFCLEYSSENLEGYRHAVRNAVNLIEPNGFLVQGGVLQANDYYFGNKRYKCHHLIREHVIESLKENNMAVKKDENFKWFEFDKVFLLIARKKVRNI